MPMIALDKRWTRWLDSQGLPSGHIARVLDVDQADVDEVLSRRPFCQFTIETEDAVRRLASEGRTCPEIGAELGMHRQTVHTIVHRSPIPAPSPPPRSRGKGIHGPTATKVRRLTELGYDPARIAAILAIRRADVIDFLDRTRPLRRPKNGTAELTRPRDRTEHKRAMATIRRRERRRRPPAEPDDDGWTYRDLDPRGLEVARLSVGVLSDPAPSAIAAAELPELVAAEACAEHDQAGDELPATSAAEWGNRFGAAPVPTGSRHPRAMLDYDLAEEIRAEWARGGVTQRELALRHFISLATLKRVLSGQSYASPDGPTAAAETPTAGPTTDRRPRKPRARARVCRDWAYRDVDARQDLETAQARGMTTGSHEDASE